MVDLTIDKKRLTKVLMDRGNGLNIQYAKTLDAMGIDRTCIRPAGAPFHGIVLRKAGQTPWADQPTHHLWKSIQL
jgi:hypothetical protein